MQILHRIIFLWYLIYQRHIRSVTGSFTPQDSDKWGRINLNHFVGNNTNSDPLQEPICKQVCSFFRNTQTELFEHIK